MIPAQLLVHTASVEPYTGTGAYGDQYGSAVDVPCYYEGRRQLVRDADGAEAVSEGTLFADLEHGDTLSPGSRVTVAGRRTWVLTVSTFDDGGLTGLDHIEVALA